MKRVLSIVLVSLLVLSIVAPAFAEVDEEGNPNPMRKLGRGVGNTMFCWVELFHQPGVVNEEKGPLAAITWGLLKGIVMTPIRAIVGVYETVTFPLPVPKDYEAIIKDPEFLLEGWV